MKRIKPFDFSKWKPTPTPDEAKECLQSLENGQVLYFPNLNFQIKAQEQESFSSNLVKPGRKNISYDLSSDLTKACEANLETQNIIHEMMKRFANCALEFVQCTFPQYKKHLITGRTSFRPVEIKGRQNSSYKKNDTLLHIDSFPSTPTNGKRILRFFANVNPFDIPRVWRLGEPHKQVIKRFLPQIKSPIWGSRSLMNRFGITKSYRILYDHYMLHIHDKMKMDQSYQEKVNQEILEFPPMTCWMAFTDQVSHAVLSGQYAFEQSFYLPVEAQDSPEKSPLNYMEKLLQKSLME
ncbi:MAG: hypothetical protein S4CHLAM6_02940 [Chlamydiae bacterium]|nr:hypothetical protein [Chlamydiota bacterium]